MKKLVDKALAATVKRRTFVKMGAATASGAAVLANTLPLKAVAAEQTPKTENTNVTWSACMVNCGSRCPIQLHTKDGVITHVESDNRGEDEYGHHQIRACLRGRSIKHRIYNPDRLKYPMKRIGKRGEGRFERISWDEAFDTIANQLKHTIKNYGNDAIYYQYGTGTQGYKTDGPYAGKRLFNLLGGYLNYYGNYSWAQIQFALPFTFGGGRPAAYGSFSSEIANTKLLVMFGYNPAETRMSGGGEIYEHINAITKGNVRTIIIDPRMTDSSLRDEVEWLPIRPGTDAALVEAMAWVMIKEGLVDEAFLKQFCVGYDETTLPKSAPRNGHYKAHILGQGADGIEKTPEWAAKITGIPAQQIISLAREIGSTKPAYIVQGTGIQRQANGEQASRAICMLPILTGNIGLAGTNTGEMPGNYGYPVKTLPVGTNPIKTAIPVFKWSDAIWRHHEMTDKTDGLQGATSLKNPIKFLWNYASNITINQHSQINRTKEILSDESLCEMIVVIDNHMTPTAKFADILLPDITTAENHEIASNGYSSGSLGAVIPLSPAIEPMFECKSAYDICAGIAKRFDLEEAYTEGKTHAQWVELLYGQLRHQDPELPSIESLRKDGPFLRPAPEKGRIALEAFRTNPSKNPLNTPSGKIEIYCEKLANIASEWELPEGDVITPLPQYVTTWESHLDPLTEKFPLQLIGFHTKGRVHSTYHNVAVLREAVTDAVWMNPADAEERGLKDGDILKVWNDRGEMRVPVKITPRIMPGVAALGEGAWYSPNKDGIDHGGSFNVLTTHRNTPLSKGNPMHTNLVQIAKA